MKNRGFLLAVLVCGVLLFSCGGGGGGGGGSSSGTIGVTITDAKPSLPPGVVQVLVTIDEVSVHAAGGDWISLPLAQTPFTIDLLQFTNGNTTQLVPPVALTPGHYTQIRLGVQSATIVTNAGSFQATIPSGNLKTAEQFEFDVTGTGAVDLTVDFDLSQSLVATGAGSFMLKPVLHIVTTSQAATINGSISEAAFGTQNQATIIVTRGGAEYTRIVLTKGASGPTAFSIFWLVPSQTYVVTVQIGGNTVYSETVAGSSLPPGAVFALNGGKPI